MCEAPSLIDGGTLIGCRECWQCRERKIDDWTGRCIAESRTAKATTMITLTYGREAGEADHLRAALLTYSDVQKYFKRLRKGYNGTGKRPRGKDAPKKYPCRYFAVGEYGTLKGRAHWHLIVYWLDGVPPHQPSTRNADGQLTEVRFNEHHWFHGYSVWEPIGNTDAGAAAAVRYVCKYLQKDLDAAERQGHLAMSKVPPLGAEWFRRLAGQYVKQGLSPQNLFYSFPEIRKRNGKKKEYLLAEGSASARDFCASYLVQWEAKHGRNSWPSSPIIEAHLDRTKPEDWQERAQIELDNFKARPLPDLMPKPKTVPHGAGPFWGDEKRNTYFCQRDETLFEWVKVDLEWIWLEKIAM